MKSVSTLLFAGLMLFSSQLAAVVPVNAPAPDFKLQGYNGKTYNGKTYKLSDMKGDFVVLEWWNKDCPFVRKHYDSGNMQGLQKDYVGKGVKWFMVLSSAPDKQGYLKANDVAGVLKKEKAQPTAVLLDPDGKVGKLYGAVTTPHMYIINPKGHLIYKGAIDDKPTTDIDDVKSSKNFVTLAMAEAKAGKSIEQSSTKPYGCSVKY